MPPRPWWNVPGVYRSWAQVAAGAMLFVAGMAVSQLDVNYADGALTVRARLGGAAAGANRAHGVHTPTGHVPSRSHETTVASDNARAGSDARMLLQRVRAMIDQSESRQQRELALRLSQVAGEVDTQHQADLLRIQQNFGRQTGDGWS